MSKTASIRVGKRKQRMKDLIGLFISGIVLVPFLLVAVNSMKSKRNANLLQLSFKGISWKQARITMQKCFVQQGFLLVS